MQAPETVPSPEPVLSLTAETAAYAGKLHEAVKLVYGATKLAMGTTNHKSTGYDPKFQKEQRRYPGDMAMIERCVA